MGFLRRLRARLRYRQFDRDLAEELDVHRAMKERDLASAGLPAAEAGWQARRELGNVVYMREEARAVWIAPWLESIWQDVHYGVRSFRRERVFTVTTVLTLAIGIGATTSTYSIVDGTLFKPLPYEQPERVVMLMARNAETGELSESLSGDEAAALHGARSLTAVACYSPFADTVTALGKGEPETIRAAAVSSGFFAVLGVYPALGRAFEPCEGRSGTSQPVILTHGYWQRRFGGDPSILGRTVVIHSDSQSEVSGPATVVGVLPAHFWYPRMTVRGQPDLLFADADDGTRPPSAGARYFLLGRLKAGVPLHQAQAEADTMAATLSGDGTRARRRQIAVMPLRTQMVADQRVTLLTILGGVLCLLLIACVNVANLLVARGGARERELAVRTSLGAGRARIVRQLLVESVVLAVAGAVIGVCGSSWTFDLLLAQLPGNMRLVSDLGIDARALTFAALATAVAVLIFGGIPALHVSNANLMTSLKAGSRPGRPRGRLRGRRLLLIVEAALALMLLTGAGLLVNSFLRLQRIQLGFEPGNLMEATIQAPKSRYADDRQAAQFFDQAVERIRSTAGVRGATTADTPPLSGALFGAPVRIEGHTRDERVDTYRVATGYFETLGIPLIKGRLLVPQDDLPKATAAVVNETMARRFGSSAAAVGRAVTVWKDTPVRIVGVVRDARSDVRRPPAPTIYVPYDPSYRRFRFRALIVRTLPGHGDLGPSITCELASLDPLLKPSPRPLQDSLDRTGAAPRFYALIYAAFAGVGLLLAAVGIAGVAAQNVIRRTHEIGVRLALGAGSGRVVGMVARQVVGPVVVGVVAGLAGAWAMARTLAGLLFDVTPHDPATFACVAGLLVVVSLVAAWLPARRAAAVNPIDVLRAD